MIYSNNEKKLILFLKRNSDMFINREILPELLEEFCTIFLSDGDYKPSALFAAMYETVVNTPVKSHDIFYNIDRNIVNESSLKIKSQRPQLTEKKSIKKSIYEQYDDEMNFYLDEGFTKTNQKDIRYKYHRKWIVYYNSIGGTNLDKIVVGNKIIPHKKIKFNLNNLVME